MPDGCEMCFFSQDAEDEDESELQMEMGAGSWELVLYRTVDRRTVVKMRYTHAPIA